ncbi:MAG: CHAT domain-containing protein, partial [Acidobacteriota bacterium]
MGLRIKLRLDADALSEGALEGLPWELMYREETRRFVGLDRNLSLVRYLDVPLPSKPIPMPEKLRVLIVRLEPEEGMAKLDLHTESNRLQQLSLSHHRWEIQVEPKASVESLRRRLAEDGPFHVVHIMGHGGFDPETGEGLLFFERADGTVHPVSGPDLAVKLSDIEGLGLVFLNACETAQASGDSGRDPFAGVANALVRGGVPAVIAMQRPISDLAAITFSDAFYSSLSGGACVDEALVEGRQAVHSRHPEGLEWMIPVFFARVRHGALFERPLPPADDMSNRQAKGAVKAAMVLAVALLLWVAAGFLTQRSETFTIDQVVATSVQDVDGLLKSVEILPDGRMRIHFAFTNQSSEQRALGLDLEQTYLADEQGHPYRVLSSSVPLGAPAVHQKLAPGQSRELWIEVPAPLDGARRFGVSLSGTENSEVEVPFFNVELPEYAPTLSRHSSAGEGTTNPQLLEGNLALATSVPGLAAHVASVERLAEDIMRWRLAMINKSGGDLGVDFDAKRVVLVDNLGHVYTPKNFGLDRSEAFLDGVSMRRGLRFDPWFDFGPPRPGARTFSLRLATKPTSDVRFEEAKVSLKRDVPDAKDHSGSKEPTPENLLASPVPIESSLEELEVELFAVEQTDSSDMRWRLRLWNRGAKDLEWGLDYPKIYLADEQGRRYDLGAAHPKANVRKEAFTVSLLAGSRSEPWLRFPAPFVDAGSLRLYLTSSVRGLRFKTATATLTKWPGQRRSGVNDQAPAE